MKSSRGDRCPGLNMQPATRRELLKTASNGFGFLALSALMAERSYAGRHPAFTSARAPRT